MNVFIKKGTHQETKRNTEKKKYYMKEFLKKGISKSGITIRTQLIIGFVIPIIFIMTVGIVSYQKAAHGLESNYEQSTSNALEMTKNSLDSSFQIISQQVMELSQDSNVRAYSLGAYIGKSTEKSNSKNTIKSNLNVKETSSEIVQNIHIIPVNGESVITTKTLSTSEISSFMNQLENSDNAKLLANSFVTWGESHPLIDEKLEIESSEYTLFCSQAFHSGANKALIVFDISTNGILNLLQQLDFGENSHVAFVMENGKEIGTTEDISVYETDFFQTAKNSGEECFTEYVKLNKTEYFFMMYKSHAVDGYITVLVPKENIVQSSVQIRNITILLVVLSVIIAIILGSYITAGISINIRKSEKSLKRVSQGELYLSTKNERFPKNEFGRLHSAIYNTITKMRELVVEVVKMIGIVSESGSKVNESGKQVSIYVQNMNQQMQHVEKIIESESIEIENCNNQMEKLSIEIKTVSKGILETITQVHKSEEMIQNGISAVENMTKQSAETTQATGEVQKQVSKLGEKLVHISGFAKDIQNIASQTNLLSLNASIEAASAGEHGRGFSVVAEEIRKLADNAGKTASSIQDLITEITNYSQTAVERVEEAETIVTMQAESVHNTANAFNSLNLFLAQMIRDMELLSSEVDGMNTKRKTTLHSIRSISELSGQLVECSELMNESLKLQVDAAQILSLEAGNMKENMKTLQNTIETFQLEAD